jgi:hypothetical protein
MSDDVLKIIPTDPYFVPGKEAIQEAKTAFSKIILKADEINISIEENVVFVDQGENFERVLCSFCGYKLDEWWNEEMGKASENHFLDLKVLVPCCKKNTTLNDLRYEWPAGFARFIMEAINPYVNDIEESDIKTLESILGVHLRTIKAHY